MSFSAEVEEYIRESLGHLPDLELSTDEIAQLEQLVHKQKREVQQVDIQKKMLDQINDELIDRNKREEEILQKAGANEIRVPDELLDLADLAEVEINPLEKNQLGLLKGLLLVIKKSEKTVGELEKLQQNTPQEWIKKLDSSKAMVEGELQKTKTFLSDLTNTSRMFHDKAKAQTEKEKEAKSRRPDDSSFIMIEELKFGNLVKDYEEAMKMVKIADDYSGPDGKSALVGTIPVASLAQAQVHLKMLHQKINSLEDRYNELIKNSDEVDY